MKFGGIILSKYFGGMSPSSLDLCTISLLMFITKKPTGGPNCAFDGGRGPSLGGFPPNFTLPGRLGKRRLIGGGGRRGKNGGRLLPNFLDRGTRGDLLVRVNLALGSILLLTS